MRDIPGRLAWFLGNKPNGSARCAEHTWHALGGPTDPPRQNLPSATAVANKTMSSGHALNHGPAPKGAVHYWSGGSAGHGHVGIAADDAGAVASVDVGGPGTVGIRPLAWFKANWPSLRYLGWSWWWGAHNTEPKEAAVAQRVWKVGEDVVVEKAGVIVTAGKYAEVARITLGAEGSYALTFQTRLPAGRSGRWQFTRVGWGKDTDGRDETGPNPLTPPDGAATSFTHTHRINGGRVGVVAFEIKVNGTGKVTLPYIICKAERIT